MALKPETAERELIIGKVVSNACALTLVIFSRVIFDTVLPSQNADSLWAMVILALGLGVGVDFLIQRRRSRLLERLGGQARHEAMLDQARRLLGQRLGSRMVPVAAGLQSLADLAVDHDRRMAIAEFQSDLPFAVLFWLLMTWIAWPVGLGVLALLMGIGYWLIKRQSAKERAAKKAAEAMASSRLLLSQGLTGAVAMTLCNAADRSLDRICEGSRAAASWNAHFRELAAEGTQLQAKTANLLTILATAGGAVLIWGGQLTTGGIMALTILSGQITRTLYQGVGIMTMAAQAKAARERLNALDWATAAAEDGTEVPSVIEGRIELQDANYQPNPDGAPVVADATLAVEPGDVLVVLGKSGSSKTSLLMLIAGAYTPTSGSVRVSGVETKNWRQNALRPRTVAMSEQTPTLFAGTLIENLRLAAPEAAPERAQALLDAVGLGHLPLDMQIEESGGRLSAGMKSRIGLVRTLIADAVITILDEPTASLDNETAAMVVQLLKRERERAPERTWVLATHDNRPLELATKAIYMDKGRIAGDLTNQLPANRAKAVAQAA